MKRNTPVTGNNVPVGKDANILSTTDAKGRITRVNEEFVDICGFQPDELIGQPHNVIRHPDMPRAAFEQMWQRLKNGQSWLGAVKNRCKNGDHYWVQAYAIPIKDDQGNVLELQSVRSRLPDDARDRAESIYAKLREQEPDKGPIEVPKLRRAPSLLAKLSASVAVPAVLAAVAQYFLPWAWADLAALALALLLMVGLVAWQLAPFNALVHQSRQQIDDPLAEQIFVGCSDDIGSLQLMCWHLKAELDAVTKRMDDVSQQLVTTSDDTIGKSLEAEDAVKHQQDATDTIAAATEEMSATAREVADTAAGLLEDVKEMRSQVNDSGELTRQTRASMDRLASEMQHTSAVISELTDAGGRVEKALSVINEITEQTNLLALNASIEAARAGEAGRGFAVVADEVRSLSLKTKESTDQINQTLETFQASVAEASGSMERCGDLAKATAEYATTSESHLQDMNDRIDRIAGAGESTSAATTQQNEAAEEIASKLVHITDSGGQALRLVEGSRTAMTGLKEEISQLSGLSKGLRQRA